MSHRLLAGLALLVAGCAPKTPQPQLPERVVLPPVYKPIAITDLNRPLPPSPEPCQVGSRQAGAVITELVACGDRGVSRVMVLPDQAPDAESLLAMAEAGLARRGITVEAQPTTFTTDGRTLQARRLVREGEFAGLAVVNPQAPWPELLTCSAPRALNGLEDWCARAIAALLMPASETEAGEAEGG